MKKEKKERFTSPSISAAILVSGTAASRDGGERTAPWNARPGCLLRAAIRTAPFKRREGEGGKRRKEEKLDSAVVSFAAGIEAGGR